MNSTMINQPNNHMSPNHVVMPLVASYFMPTNKNALSGKSPSAYHIKFNKQHEHQHVSKSASPPSITTIPEEDQDQDSDSQSSTLSFSDSQTKDARSQQEIMMAVESEKKEFNGIKLKLENLHKIQNKKLKALKCRVEELKKKKRILYQHETSSALESFLKNKQNIYKYLMDRQRTTQQDEAKLNQALRENSKLKTIITHLNHGVAQLIQQYQHLCSIQQSPDVDEEEFQAPDASGIIQRYPKFSQIIDENRTLERQIKFLQHIVKKEKERSQLNAI